MSTDAQIDQIQTNPEDEWGSWFECDKGWYPLIAELHAKLTVLSPDYSLLQVKEKFGGLRYYTALDGVDDATAKAFFGLIEEAEARSFQVCELCGEPGALSRKGGQRGWLKTLCPGCAESMGFQPLDDEAAR